MSEEDKTEIEITRKDIIIPKSREMLEKKLKELFLECGIKIEIDNMLDWLAFLSGLENYYKKLKEEEVLKKIKELKEDLNLHDSRICIGCKKINEIIDKIFKKEIKNE